MFSKILKAIGLGTRTRTRGRRTRGKGKGKRKGKHTRKMRGGRAPAVEPFKQKTA